MAGVIADPREALDHRGHARQRPQIGAEVMRGGARAQGRVHPRQLPRVQPRLAAQPPRRLQAAAALLAPDLVPAVRGLPTDPHGMDHRGLRLPPRKQAGCQKATRFQRHHVSVPTLELGHASASDRSA